MQYFKYHYQKNKNLKINQIYLLLIWENAKK